MIIKVQFEFWASCNLKEIHKSRDLKKHQRQDNPTNLQNINKIVNFLNAFPCPYFLCETITELLLHYNK